MIGVLIAGSDPEAIRRKAAEVFARPEYNPEKPWFPFEQWIKDFFSWLSRIGGSSPYLWYAMVAGCAILLVVLLVLIARMLFRSATLGAIGAEGRARAQRMRMSAAHFTKAGECAQQGDYTEAIRYLFLALVFRFDEAGRVVLRPAATNREYLNLLDNHLPERRELGSFVDFLDNFWYGQHPTDRSQYERSLSVYQRLVN